MAQLIQEAVVRPAPPLPPNSKANYFRSAVSVRTKKLEPATQSVSAPKGAESPFEPCPFFFYGSLMDPEVLQPILELPEAPIVESGSVCGFFIKMWGIYPALIPHEGGRVSGSMWRVTTESHYLRLKEYETSAYTWCACDIELNSGEVLSRCRTLCWAGDSDRKELEEGTFDLQRYQRYFKASVGRKSP
ncbi:hypothetical protein VC83_04581 [Pseudogymnoascus destructans]|uniref:Putative gamma-glutamylcyclotransferase n=2 Tax=Pseudogymnoascus destructans TaxID=655981 RepID=L8GB33_PSED2|nr:uncharacterized protein VC83_04581 [Pseudogymnoascus destructans]ELR10287.1 hypothetical protein GMDG_04673 [Pseudogymnoascus destructans 20631-21]OAF57287.1 hypothetical protein VC83_04581 [Pseudogymnoascus destructans]